MKEQKIPGIAIAYFDGKTGDVLSYGVADKKKGIPVTPYTLFDIASVTKVFTATELALLVSKGRVSLNDPVTKYLPGIDKKIGTINKVTLLELATHSSSLPRELKQSRKVDYTESQLLKYLQHWNPANPVGSHFLYSNLGFGILGLALEKEQRTSYFSMIENDILRPLGMISTVIDVPGNLESHLAQGYSEDGNLVSIEAHRRNILPGSGSLRSTANDLLKFLEANLGIKGPHDLLKAMQLAQKEHYRASDKLAMGLAWQRGKQQGNLIIDKNGSLPGFSSYIGMIPDKKIGIVILSNRVKTNNTKLGRNLLVKLAEASNALEEKQGLSE